MYKLYGFSRVITGRRREDEGMYTWFSDLDSTLIYSHRTDFSTEKVPVEYLHGKEQSYMTQRTYDFLRDLSIDLVPVTTRSIEQYNRLFVFEREISATHALVCNGAILLHRGEVDKKWLDETKRIAQKGICELEVIQKELSGYNVKNVEGVMLYFKAENPETEAMYFRQRYAEENVYIGFDKRKVYIIPSEINKGSAICRYCERFGISETIASGDSEFDVPMLNVANISMCPERLLSRVKAKTKVCSLGEDSIISDRICECLSVILQGE